MRALLVIVLAAALASFAKVHAGDLVEDCNSDDPRVAVAGCSRLIAEVDLPADKLSTALNNRGIAYAAGGVVELAIADFVVASRVDAGNVMAFNNLCHIWLDVEQPRRALAACNRAIDVNPNFYEAFSNRSLALQGLGDLESALADASHALDLNPSCPITRANRGFLYERSGRPSEAIADYEAALRAMPDLALAREGLARLRQGASLAPPATARPRPVGQIEVARNGHLLHRGCAPSAGLH
ncbi:MAG: tetratricopeptide repeat protein [Pseudomonadota bacterium]